MEVAFRYIFKYHEGTTASMPSRCLALNYKSPHCQKECTVWAYCGMVSYLYEMYDTHEVIVNTDVNMMGIIQLSIKSLYRNAGALWNKVF